MSIMVGEMIMIKNQDNPIMQVRQESRPLLHIIMVRIDLLWYESIPRIKTIANMENEYPP